MTFVEVLDRRGRVRGRVKVDSLPFRIGRGYDCDLILDDPHVSPLHAVVERDAEGRLTLRDAGSRNGLFLDGKRNRVERVALDGDVSIQLGRTLLRLRSPDFRVPEAAPIVRHSSLTEWLLEHWSAAVVIPALTLLLMVFDEYRKTTVAFETTDALATVAQQLLVFGAWIGPWALLNRLLRHRSRFVAHSSVAFGVSVLYTLATWGFEWLHFLLAPVEPLRLLELVVTTVFWALVLLGHLTVMGVARPRVRAAIVGVGFAALLSVQLLDHFDDGIDWVATLPYWSRLEPVDPSWLPVESADTFFAGIHELERELDELAREAEDEEEALEADPDEDGAEDPSVPEPEPVLAP